MVCVCKLSVLGQQSVHNDLNPSTSFQKQWHDKNDPQKLSNKAYKISNLILSGSFLCI